MFTVVLHGASSSLISYIYAVDASGASPVRYFSIIGVRKTSGVLRKRGEANATCRHLISGA